MKIDARSASAKDFDRVAQNHASAFWWELIAAAVVWYFFSWWWAAIPALGAIWSAVKSVSATRCANQLRKGTYTIPNPNNGRSD